MLQIQKADLSNSAILELLINEAYRVEEFFVSGNRISQAEIADLLRKGNFLLALNDSSSVGCVYLEIKKDHGYLGLLSVSPKVQGQGVGKQLVTAAENLAREAGCLYMDLNIVNLREELPLFYHKLGYRETGETAPFPPRQLVTTEPCYFVMMSKVLREEERQP